MRILSLTFCLFIMPFCAYAQNSGSATLIQFKKSQSLGMPIDCSLNKNCWVMNYVDFDLSDEAYTDPNCLSRTYDTHKGTDFALLDEKSMNKGVPVLATKDGIVDRLRDGENDLWKTPEDLEKIKTERKECGNAIMLNHNDETKSIYCHVRQNSIIVKKGQRVKKGDTIAMVGMSGLTQFPHLHYGLIKDKQIIDPFTGRSTATMCGLQNAKPLWDKDLLLSYQPFSIQSSGFSTQIPNLDELGRDSASLDKITLKNDNIVFWTILLGVRVDDKIKMTIYDANNKVLATRDITQDKDRARQLYFVGKKINDKNLIAGAYTAQVKVTRPHNTKSDISASQTSANAPDISQYQTKTVLVTP